MLEIFLCLFRGKYSNREDQGRRDEVRGKIVSTECLDCRRDRIELELRVGHCVCRVDVIYTRLL